MKLNKISAVSAVIILMNLFCLCPAANSTSLRLDNDSARLKALTFDNELIQIPPDTQGGFSVYDVTNDLRISFEKGSVTQKNHTRSFACRHADLKLHAEFQPHSRFVLVRGNIENLRNTDRAIVLDYRIPLDAKTTTFSYELNKSVQISSPSETLEANVFPIAALTADEQTLAMAIPPSQPRIFGMVSGNASLAVRFYLGLTDATKRFPNTASFEFIIYPSDPDWPFRTALQKYYNFFPQYYTPTIGNDGLWMCALTGKVPPNVRQYGYNRSLMPKGVLEKDIPRDEKYDILTYPSNIVGMREIRNLPSTPNDYNQAMGIYHRFCKENGKPVGYYSESGSADVCRQIDNSVCFDAEGRRTLIPRETFWGGSSLTFKTNPNPELFSDTNEPSVGRENLKLIMETLKDYPRLDGMFLDSLGRIWPGLLNYRREHFAYARYPLTFDPNGRLALHNKLSHYEFIETLWNKLRKQGRSLFANGVYAYNAKTDPPEHYRGKTRVGRFFMVSMLQIAGSEAGIKASQQRCQDVRTYMGRKIYAFLNYEWKDISKVEDFLNLCLCYGIVGTNKDNPFTKEIYFEHPQGYAISKHLVDWFVPKARLLHRAGWQPVTHACPTPQKDIYIERFGSTNNIYFTLLNESQTEKDVVLTVDLQAMYIDSADIIIDEIARGVALDRLADNRFKLTLKPHKTAVIAVRQF